MKTHVPVLNKKYLKKYENIIPFINKQTIFKFFGEKLLFLLSQELFSSFKVDSGSALLLKTIAKEIKISKGDSILDIGCGTGIIGLSLKKKYPDININMKDRDALALEFTCLNAEYNSIENCIVSGELGTGCEREKYDLITANLPAKAGSPVIKYLLKSILCSRKQNGTGAAVIVKTLRSFAFDIIKGLRAELIFEEHSKDYSVFHFKRKADTEIDNSIKNYIRTKSDFVFGKIEYILETAYNLPDFDTIGYQTGLLMELIRWENLRGTAIFYNPGQGHLPVFCSKASEITEYNFCGRDLLSLKISEYNLEKYFSGNVVLSHVPCYKALNNGKKYDIIVFNSQSIWLADLYSDFFKIFKNILRDNGIIFISAKSTWMHRLLKYRHGLKVLADKKEYGFRALALKKI